MPMICTEKRDPDVIEEIRKHVVNGIFSYLRIENSKIEMIIVPTNLERRKGVFYYPIPVSEAIPLIEIESNGNFKVYLENLKKVPEV